ncbi:MAG: hypothetical protein NT013_22490 [Planctomycetia bacterium]|nr:hypothetical protein [Planctomycetia bacterium]
MSSAQTMVPQVMRHRCHLLIGVLWFAFGSIGCATLPYQFGTASGYRTSSELQFMTSSEQIERGTPHKVLDTIGWVFAIPDKIILWDQRIGNHDVGPQTETAIADYLSKNELSSVKVRLNQYHPGDDWRRLRANESVGAGWRYTLGTLSVLGETIIPGRVFGGDHYNPFTNTVHLYSDVPSVAIHEAGHSKDFAGRTWKGSYAALYLLPGAPLYHEAKATNDALGYVMTEGDLQQQREAYEILYPAYGTYIGSAIGGSNGLGYIAAVVGGHVAGRINASDNERSAAQRSSQNAALKSAAVKRTNPNSEAIGYSELPQQGGDSESQLAESSIESP